MDNAKTTKLSSLLIFGLLPVLVGIVVTLILTTLLNKWCVFDPWYLLIKSKHLYGHISLSIVILFLLRGKIVNRYSSVGGNLKARKFAIKIMAIVFGLTACMRIYTEMFYSTFPKDVCDMQNVNYDYYKSSGQKRFID